MAFWGVAVKAGKEAPFVPSPEADEKLHVSQACMAPGASKNAKATLMIRVGDNDEALAVASLREGSTESVALDLVLDEYTEFTVIGNATVHLTGYYMPEYAIDGEDGGPEDDDEDDELNAMNDQILGFDEYGVPIIAGEYDSEEDSDFDSDDMDDMDDDSEDEFDSAEEDLIGEDGVNRRKSGGVVIEDITDGDKAKKVTAVAAQEFDDDDVEGSDEESEDDEEDNDDDDEEEEEEEESEEEEKPAPQLQKTKAATAPVEKAKPQANNNKRKAEDEKPSAVVKNEKPAEKKKKEEPKKKEPVATKKSKTEQEEEKIVAGQVASGSKRVRRYANGFEIEDVKMGSSTGKLAKPGKTVVVRYVGRLKNGKVFDQTNGKRTFNFRLGVGEVIKGWDRGIEGMRVGDKRKLIIPPVMGYGSSKMGSIPANSELHFDVELVDVK